MNYPVPEYYGLDSIRTPVKTHKDAAILNSEARQYAEMIAAQRREAHEARPDIRGGIIGGE